MIVHAPWGMWRPDLSMAPGRLSVNAHPVFHLMSATQEALFFPPLWSHKLSFPCIWETWPALPSSSWPWGWACTTNWADNSISFLQTKWRNQRFAHNLSKTKVLPRNGGKVGKDPFPFSKCALVTARAGDQSETGKVPCIGTGCKDTLNLGVLQKQSWYLKVRTSLTHTPPLPLGPQPGLGPEKVWS